MTILLAHDTPVTASTRRAAWLAAAAGVAVLGAGAGLFAAQSAAPADLTWQEGPAEVGVAAMTVQVDGWEYAAAGSVPRWVDEAGTWHDGGWPTCLPTGPGTVTVRFAAARVAVDGAETRPVVAVDCRR